MILAGHLACAAAELPFERRRAVSVGKLTAAPATGLTCSTTWSRLASSTAAVSRYFWAGDGSPATALSLRTSSPDRVVIQAADERGQPQVIGELERRARRHPAVQGAIYLHEGQSYLVERLDWEGGVADVRPVEVDFYTRPIIGEKIEILTTNGRKPQGQMTTLNSAVPASC